MRIPTSIACPALPRSKVYRGIRSQVEDGMHYLLRHREQVHV